MAEPDTYSFIRYLAAQKSVDDRALNRHVWQSLMKALPAATQDEPLRILEVGAGIGTMIERLAEWRALSQVVYTAIDAGPENVSECRRRLPAWAVQRGFVVKEAANGRMSLQRGEQRLLIELEPADVFDFIRRERGARAWDLLIANAFLDVVNVAAILPEFFSVLKNRGLLYLTIVFDGATILQPAIDPVFDDHVEALYHQRAENRIVNAQPSGDSQAGRHLFEQLRKAGGELMNAGSSDRVVFAGPDGYEEDEKCFLHFIVHTIYTTLKEHPRLDAARFADWIAHRHAQIEQGVLVYIAHQLDFPGRNIAPQSFRKPLLESLIVQLSCR